MSDVTELRQFIPPADTSLTSSLCVTSFMSPSFLGTEREVQVVRFKDLPILSFFFAYHDDLKLEEDGWYIKLTNREALLLLSEEDDSNRNGLESRVRLSPDYLVYPHSALIVLTRPERIFAPGKVPV